MVKRAGKYVFILSLLIIGGSMLYLLSALILSLVPGSATRQNCPAEQKIFIASNGIHLDIIMPVENIDPQILQNLVILPRTSHVAFGWGDKEFYIKTPEWSDLTFSVAFNALFLKSETAMHVTCLSFSSPSWQAVDLCTDQLAGLNCYILHSFKKTESGNFEKMDFEGYNQFDSFYNAHGSFSLFRTCNIWVNNALKKAEVRTAVWSPFDFGVLYHLRKKK